MAALRLLSALLRKPRSLLIFALCSVGALTVLFGLALALRRFRWRCGPRKGLARVVVHPQTMRDFAEKVGQHLGGANSFLDMGDEVAGADDFVRRRQRLREAQEVVIVVPPAAQWQHDPVFREAMEFCFWSEARCILLVLDADLRAKPLWQWPLNARYRSLRVRWLSQYDMMAADS